MRRRPTHWGEITVPGSWAMQDKGDLPQYTNIVMPFPDLPPSVPKANPTGPLRPDIRGPGTMGRPPDRPPSRRGRERGDRAPERPRRGHRQGQPPRVRVRARTRTWSRARTRSRSVWSSGPTRASSRTRTSGGSVASPARCTSTRPAGRTSPTSRRSPGLADDLTTGTLDLGAVVAFDRGVPEHGWIVEAELGVPGIPVTFRAEATVVDTVRDRWEPLDDRGQRRSSAPRPGSTPP